MLSPAYFSPNYKYFDQLLQTVKNKTTVLILVFKEFLQTLIPPLISVLYAKGYHYFPLKNFRLTLPNNFAEEHVCVSENFGYRKNLWIRGGGGECHDFLSIFFCLIVPKNFVGEPFNVSLILGIEKILCFRELCHDFMSKLFCLIVPKSFVGEPFNVSLISGIEKILCFRELCHDFMSKFFCIIVPKNFVEEPF